jgi:hypothetical protein
VPVLGVGRAASHEACLDALAHDPDELFCRRAAGMFAELRAKLQVAAR